MRKHVSATLIWTGLALVCGGCGGGGDPVSPSGATQFTVPVSDPDRTTVDALIFDDRVYPVSKFRSGTGSECGGAAHWHSNSKVVAIGRLFREPSGDIFVCYDQLEEGAPSVVDPAPTGCGHGKVSEVTRQEVQLFQKCLADYNKSSSIGDGHTAS